MLVEPTIGLDNSVEVKLGLEVSTLGENIGTVEEAAFRIGTRNADTYMLLRDGETAILGGLIRDEDRNTKVRIPGLGDIPVVGTLFSNYDNSGGQTDILLTITPRVVRGWDLPRPELREFYSGNAENYMSQAIFQAEPARGEQEPTPELPGFLSAAKPEAPAAEASAAASNAKTSAAPPDRLGPPSKPVFAFSQPIYEMAAGEETEVELIGRNLRDIGQVNMDVVFDPKLLAYRSAEPGTEGIAGFDARQVGRDAVRFSVTPPPGPGGGQGDPAPPREVVLARMILRGDKAGISYLVYRVPPLTDAQGRSFDAQLRASRIVIK